MNHATRRVPAAATVLLTAVLALSGARVFVRGQQPPPPAPDPLIRENAVTKISDHVFAIPDGNVPLVPNVGIVAGSTATLVVDSGLGPRNGQAVLNVVNKVSRKPALFVVSTHFHPEHALGEPAFPADAKIVRAQAQQKDIDEFGLALAETFSRRSPLTADLLRGVQFRRADILFDKERTLDLGGGVTVRLVALGPAHTRGDTIAFVMPDRVLFAGDIVMNRFLAFASPSSQVKPWLAALDALTPLQPRRIVPSHGDMGDASLLAKDRAYLTALQARVAECKKQGKSVDETAELLMKEFQSKYPEWTNPMAVTAAVRAAYAEAP